MPHGAHVQLPDSSSAPPFQGMRQGAQRITRHGRVGLGLRCAHRSGTNWNASVTRGSNVTPPFPNPRVARQKDVAEKASHRDQQHTLQYQ